MKYLVEACNKNITALDKTVKYLDKKSNKGNQGNHKNDENKNSNYGNRAPKTPVMYCHSCGRINDPLHLSMDFPNPKHGKKCNTTSKRKYRGS